MIHLHESVRETASGTDEERIRLINDYRWIKYPAAEKILNRLEELLVHPKISRMPNMLIVGESNNGKTVLVERFLKLHRPVVNEDNVSAPVIYMQAPSVPDEKRFYNKLLDQLNAPYRLVDKVERKEQQAFAAMEMIGVKMLIIDEIHSILSGSTSRQRAFLNVIKYMANELRIVIVAVGVKEALNAMSTDAQISNRFIPSFLPKWQYNEDYIRLLASFEMLLPLRNPSGLIGEGISSKVLQMSEGTIGEITKVLTLAATAAVKSGKEKIDLTTLNEIEYVRPSERRRITEKFI